MYEDIIISLTERYTTLTLFLTFLSIVILFFVNFREIKNHFRKISKRVWFMLFFIFIIGLYLRTKWPGCDWGAVMWEYVVNAKRMLSNQPIDMLHPRGYSFMIALVSFFFGLNYSTIIGYNIFISTLTIFIIFLITYLISEDEYTSLISSLMFAMLPNSVRLSQTGVSEITGTFFVGLSVLFLLISFKSKNIKGKAFNLAFLSLVFSISTRLENTMFIGLFMVSCMIFLSRNQLRKLLIPTLVFGVFMIQLLPFYMFGKRNFGFESLDPVGRKLFKENYPFINNPKTFSVAYLHTNTEANIHRLTDPVYPFIVYFFMFLSLLRIKKYPKMVIPILWIFIFMLFFGLWFMTFIGPIDLYQILLHPPFAILAGMGVLVAYELIVKIFSSMKMKRYQAAKTIFFVMITLIIITLFYQRMVSVYQEETCLSKDIIRVASDIENSCIIMERRINEPEWKNLFSISQFLIPNNEVVDTINGCHSEDMYYIRPNKNYIEEIEKSEGTVLKNPEFEYLKEQCELLVNNETENVIVYKVKC